MSRTQVTFALITVVAALLLLTAGWLAYDFLFVPHFDDNDLRQSFETIQKKYAFPSLTIEQVRGAARQHPAADSFCIPVTPRYELLVFRVPRWSEKRGSYNQWRLYPEPLYTRQYITTAYTAGVRLAPIDFCRHHLSEYLRTQTPFEEDLVWQWPNTTVRNLDGTHSISIGMSAIAGSGVRVTVNKSGELIGCEMLFSPD